MNVAASSTRQKVTAEPHAPAGQDSLNLILHAAADCFMERGFAATSIDDVARRLGATKGMIYHHFRSKNDLFFAVYRHGMELNFDAVTRHDRADEEPVSRLAKMALAHAINIMALQAWQRVQSEGVSMHLRGATTAEQRATLDELIDMRDRYETMFKHAIGSALGETSRQPDPLAVKCFLSVLNSTVVWYTPRKGNEAKEQRRIAEDLVLYAMKGLGLKPPALSTIKLGDE